VVNLYVKFQKSAIFRQSWCMTFLTLRVWRARQRAREGAVTGRSSHHHVEAVFKAFARALRSPAHGTRGWQGCCRARSAAVIALIDYGAGNLTSVRKALTALGADFATPFVSGGLCAFSASSSPRRQLRFDAALVGPWHDAIGSAVRGGTPLFGILPRDAVAVRGSDEAPEVPGLGVLPGRVTALQGDTAARLKIPHVGWNALDFRESARILAGLEPRSMCTSRIVRRPRHRRLCRCDTHARPSPRCRRGNVFGVQFHPEKSSDAGLQNTPQLPRGRSRLARIAPRAEAGC